MCVTSNPIQPRSKPSAYVRRFAQFLNESARGFPIADIGCGSGRNSLFILQMGCKVICIDKELTHFRRKPELDLRSQDRLKVLLLDVLKEPWPFAASTLGGIIIVDFLPWKLFPRIVESLIPSGCMLLETVSGRGGNFRELPRAGQLKAIFEGSIIIEDYKEKYVGPRTTEAVTVKMIGRRGR